MQEGADNDRLADPKAPYLAGYTISPGPMPPVEARGTWHTGCHLPPKQEGADNDRVDPKASILGQDGVGLLANRPVLHDAGHACANHHGEGNFSLPPLCDEMLERSCENCLPSVRKRNARRRPRSDEANRAMCIHVCSVCKCDVRNFGVENSDVKM